MPDISKTESAYLAGLWDGEGSITLWKNIRKETGNPRLIASLVFINTNLKMIEWVEDKLAKINATFHRYVIRYDGKQKDCYQQTARNREAVERTIRTILPYLVAKKKQAEIVLSFVLSRKEQLRKSNGKPSSSCPYTDKEFAMETEIRKLNKLGKSESPETKH